MSMFYVIHEILIVFISFFREHINNFVLFLLYSIIIDIFSFSSEPISLHLGCCGGSR